MAIQIDEIDYTLTQAPAIPLIEEGEETFSDKEEAWLSFIKDVEIPERNTLNQKLDTFAQQVNAAGQEIEANTNEVAANTEIALALGGGTYMPGYTGSGAVPANTTVSWDGAIWYTADGTSDVPSEASPGWLLVNRIAPKMLEARFYSENHYVEYGSSTVVNSTGTGVKLHHVDISFMRQGDKCHVSGSLNVSHTASLSAGTTYRVDINLLRLAHSVGAFGHIKYTDIASGCVTQTYDVLHPISVPSDIAKHLRTFTFVDNSVVSMWFKMISASTDVSLTFDILLDVGDEYMPYEVYFPQTAISVPVGTASVQVDAEIGRAPSLAGLLVVYSGSESGYADLLQGHTSVSITVPTLSMTAGQTKTIHIDQALGTEYQPSASVSTTANTCVITAV